jgi:hypothetical protein
MTSPKRHHYVPRFLLMRFTDATGMLAVYDRARDEFRPQTPLNTAVLQHYYSYHTTDGTRSAEVEEGLGRIESDATPVIQKLDGPVPLTVDERYLVALFIALLHTRSPQFARGSNELLRGMMPHLTRDRFPTVESLATAMRAHEEETGRALEMTPAQVYETLQRDDLGIEATPAARMRLMLSTAVQLAPLLACMQWRVLHAPREESFVLADNPMHIIPHEDTPLGVHTGVATPGAHKWVPLGARMGVLIGDMGASMQHVEVDEAKVQALNFETTVRAEDFVFARDEQLLRNVVAATGLATRAKLPLITVS